jgi:acyl-CoA reductase-like NAD-dependent aldehyde dehydrogenase
VQTATRAIAAARRAFATYGRSSKEERVEILRRLHAAASARADDLTAAMVEEYGGVVQFAGLIAQSGVTAFRAAEQALQEMPSRAGLPRAGAVPRIGIRVSVVPNGSPCPRRRRSQAWASRTMRFTKPGGSCDLSM